MRLPEFLLGMILGAALRQRPPKRKVPLWAVLASGVAVFLVSMNTVHRVGLWTRAYCFFLAQLPVLGWLDAAAEKHSTLTVWAAGAPLAATVACALVVLGLAIALHEGVEKPARRWILRRSAAGQMKLETAALPVI